jgi:spermidine synthase
MARVRCTSPSVKSRAALRLDRPEELEVDYTRTMMGFLLLAPRPGRIAMIGLGGGSLVKFCHRHLGAARMTVVENNPGVIALRSRFGIPDDDERLTVLADDGASFVARTTDAFDVLLVDGFDHTGQPPQLCSQAFYDGCFRALAPGGVLVANLHADDSGHAEWARRIARSFGGSAMQVLSAEQSNCIVFAARGAPATTQALRSANWVKAVDAQARRQLQGEFARIGWNAGEVRPAV